MWIFNKSVNLIEKSSKIPELSGPSIWLIIAYYQNEQGDLQMFCLVKDFSSPQLLVYFQCITLPFSVGSPPPSSRNTNQQENPLVQSTQIHIDTGMQNLKFLFTDRIYTETNSFKNFKFCIPVSMCICVDWTKGFSCWLVFLDEGGGEPTEKGKVMH
jgi:hypothetical protein